MIQVCQVVHSGEAMVRCANLPGNRDPVRPHQLLHGNIHGPWRHTQGQPRRGQGR